MFFRQIKIKAALLFVIAAVLIVISVPRIGNSAIPKDTVTYTDGLISIQYSGKRLGYLLDELAEMLSITVYLYDNSGSEYVMVSMEDRDPVDALKSILRNRNYCIIFNEEPGRGGVERLYGLTGKSSSRSSEDNYWVAEDDSTDTNDAYDKQQSKIASLKGKIESIQQQIESGEADRWYEKWSGIKGEKYVTHPAEKLTRLEEQLEELLYGG